MRAWAGLLGLTVFVTGCGDDTTSGTGGSGGSGGSGANGGSGGGGGAERACPAKAGDAPCDLSAMQNDGLVCEYAPTMGCPTIFVCSSNSATHFGWLPRPPEDGSSCATDAQVCTYEDPNLDSGLTTVFTATCTGGSWMVVETTKPNE